MTNEQVHPLDHLTSWITIAVLVLVPLVFLPFTVDPLETTKWFVLMIGALVVFALWLVRGATTGQARIHGTGAALGLSLLTLGALVGGFTSSSHPFAAIATPYGLMTFASLVILLVCGAPATRRLRKKLRWFLMASVMFLSLLAVYQSLGFHRFLPPAMAFLGEALWTPAGSSLALVGFLLVTLPFLVIREKPTDGKRESWSTYVPGIVIVLASIAIGIIIYQYIPKYIETVLPYSAAWTILLETWKQWPHIITGVGPDNYLTAFTLGRPAWMNLTTLWNSRFLTGTSLAIHTATTMGIFGALGMIILLRSLVGIILSPHKPLTLKASAIAAIIAIVALPPSLTILVALVILLILASDGVGSEVSFPVHGGIARWGVTFVVILSSGVLVYLVSRGYLAEARYAKALEALAALDGTNAYNEHIQAITLNPYETRYHMSYSRTNLAVAEAIADRFRTDQSRETPSSFLPAPLPEADRTLATQLIQQAIREAKIAVNLNPTSVLAWENLADIYIAITGSARGADTWAVAALQRAVQLDPTNPVLRVRLGSAYVAAADLPRAIDAYRMAATLKPDLANAYYNLAFAYRQHKEYLNAAMALKETQALVAAGSDDGRRVEGELEQVQSLLTSQEQTTLEATTPSASPTDQAYPLGQPTLSPDETADYLLAPEASPPGSLP